MAVQKNFIIRNGLEVNSNLLVADSVTDSVGIGTSNPNYTLEVIGGIGATHINILGISTVLTEFNVGTGGTVITSLDTGLTGFGTAIPAYVVDIRSPVSTGQTALYVQGDVRVTGDLYADDISFDQATLNNLEVTGVGTIATASIDLGYVNTGIVTNLITSGIGTIETASINLGYTNTGIVTNLITSGIGSITVAAIRDGYINTGIVTNLVTTGIASVAVGVITDAYVTTGIVTNLVTSGIGSITTAAIDTGYINTGIITTLSGSNLNYSGIGSFGSINTPTARITTGIVTTIDSANLRVSGIASINTGVVTTAYVNTGSITTLSGCNLTYSGIGSFGSVNADTGRINTGIVTNLSTSGIATITTAVIGTGNINTGVVTTISGSNLNYSGIGSFGSINAATGRITRGIITTLTGTRLNYSGIGTITDFKATNANVSGVTTTGTLAVNTGFDVYASNATFHNDVTINGNLSIGGTSAVINAVELRVEDKDIILGFTTSQTPTDDTANHGGIAIASTEGTPLVSFAVTGINTLPDTYKQIMWVKRNTMGAGTTDAFLFNYGVGIGSTQVPTGVRLAVGSVQISDNLVNTTNLNATGVTTSNSYNVGGTQVISAARELQNIASLDATTTATIEAAIANAPNTFQDIVVTGIASINTGVFTSLYSPIGIITTLNGANINYSGIGSFGSINADIGRINTGIVTNLTVSGIATFQSDVKLGDNDKLYFGDGNDLEIYHTGSETIISDVGTGPLYIRGSNSVLLQHPSTGEYYAKFNEDSAVELYYDNVKEFETTGYGATVYGVLQSQGLNSSGIATISVNSSSDALRITQTGAGNALVVEDSANPDSTPFVVTASGSVGIGTLFPQDTLDVRQNATSSTNLMEIGLKDQTINPRFRFEANESDNVVRLNTNYQGSISPSMTFGVSGGLERVRFDIQNGRVGIGITNPEQLLEVSSSSSPTIRINNSDGSISADQTIGAIEFKANDGSGDGSQVTGSIESISQAAYTGQGSPAHLVFKTNGPSGAGALAERLRITSTGNVGINSTTPLTTLDVGGTASIKVPVGTTAERPGSPVRGFVRFNTDLTTFEGYNGTEWGGLGGAAEKDTAVSTTSATTCESFAAASYRSATITAQITQGSNYQVGKYVVIHDGTTATLIEESAIATGSMLGSFTATISGGNLLFQVNMSSASSATVTTLMTKISV